MPNETQNTEQLRAQAALLLSQARQQSFDIQQALGGVNIDSTLQARLAAAAAQISGAMSSLSQALGSTSFPLRAADLAAIESVVYSGETTALLTEATQAAATATRAQNLAVAYAAVRQEVQDLSRDMFEKRIFDPYLHFSSQKDEEEYRKRQAEAQRYINEQLARHTPEGDLNAAQAMKRSMLDAKDHGADKSPDYAPRINELNERIDRLTEAMPTRSRSDADRTAGSDPSKSLPRVAATPGAGTRDASAGIDFAAMDAKLEAAGLQVPASADATGHGLSIQKPAGKPAVTTTG